MTKCQMDFLMFYYTIEASHPSSDRRNDKPDGVFRPRLSRYGRCPVHDGKAINSGHPDAPPPAIHSGHGRHLEISLIAWRDPDSPITRRCHKWESKRAAIPIWQPRNLYLEQMQARPCIRACLTAGCQTGRLCHTPALFRERHAVDIRLHKDRVGRQLHRSAHSR